MRRQTVHHEDTLVGRLDQTLVELVGPEDQRALLDLGLLAHARPDVGIQDVGARRSRRRIGADLDRAPGLRGDLLGARDDLRDRLEPHRGRDTHRHRRLRAGEQQRVRNVVPFTDVREDAPGDAAEVLVDRQQVGERLARVLEVRQRVHHGDRRRVRERLEPLLLERAEHDRIDVAREHAARVLDRLPAAELQVAGRQRDRVPAELRDPHLERHAGPGRGLLEDQRHRATRERVCVHLPVGLELSRKRQNGCELGRGQVVDGQVVTGHGARV